MTNENLTASAVKENLTDTQLMTNKTNISDDALHPENDSNAHLSDFELDLTIIADYIKESIGNIKNADSVVKAKKLLKDYKYSSDNLEQAKCIINLLLLTMDDLALRFYSEQMYIQKKLKKLRNKTKNQTGLLNGEFCLINDLKEIITN